MKSTTKAKFAAGIIYLSSLALGAGGVTLAIKGAVNKYNAVSAKYSDQQYSQYMYNSYVKGTGFALGGFALITAGRLGLIIGDGVKKRSRKRMIS
jgi:hypothetical protein